MLGKFLGNNAGKGIEVLSLNINLVSMIFALLIAVAAYIIKKALSRVVDKLSEAREEVSKRKSQQIKSIVSILIYSVALLMILGQFGLELSVLLTSFGILGFTVSFAAKDILSNLFSGIFLFFERTYELGDVVKIEDIYGIVRVIKLRSTQIETFDGNLVTIPNSRIASNPVINMTAGSDKMMTSIKFRLSYNVDFRKVRKLMERTIKEVDGTYVEEGTKFKVRESGDERLRGVEVEIFFYVESREEPWIKSKAKQRVVETLVEEGVEFASSAPSAD